MRGLHQMFTVIPEVMKHTCRDLGQVFWDVSWSSVFISSDVKSITLRTKRKTDTASSESCILFETTHISLKHSTSIVKTDTQAKTFAQIVNHDSEGSSLFILNTTLSLNLQANNRNLQANKSKNAHHRCTYLQPYHSIITLYVQKKKSFTWYTNRLSKCLNWNWTLYP